MAEELVVNVTEQVQRVEVRVTEHVQRVEVRVFEVEVGPAGTVEIGEVVTLEDGEEAYVENVGTPSGAILNMGLPRGPKGDEGEAAYRPKSPEFTRTGGKLTRIDYEDGAYKVLTRVDGKLSQIDFVRPEHPTIRKTYNRDVNGLLLSIVETEVA